MVCKEGVELKEWKRLLLVVRVEVVEGEPKKARAAAVKEGLESVALVPCGVVMLTAVSGIASNSEASA